MNILFLLSNLELTGSETYAQSLAQAWGSRHRVFWISDHLTVTSDFLSLPIRKKPMPGGFLNAWRVARFVKQNAIHVIHSHSRRANWVAALASRLTGVPHVTTVHMRSRPHFSTRLFPCWGNQAIAICESVVEYLRDVFHMPEERISLIRNGIDLERFRPVARIPRKSTRWVTVLGRLTGGRWKVIEFLLPIFQEVASRFPEVRFRLIGPISPERQAALNEEMNSLNAQFSQKRFEATGFVRDVRPFIAESTAVIASGRSLLETMAMQVPVIALGEEKALGLMTPENFALGRISNFGDFALFDRLHFDRTLVWEGLTRVLEGSLDLDSVVRWERETLEKHYDLRQVAQKVEDLYRRCISRS